MGHCKALDYNHVSFSWSEQEKRLSRSDIADEEEAEARWLRILAQVLRRMQS